MKIELKRELENMMQSESEAIQQRITNVEEAFAKNGEQSSIFDLQSDDNRTEPNIVDSIKDLRIKMMLNARGETPIHTYRAQGFCWFVRLQSTHFCY
jgi:hypothetical protein